MTQEKSGAAFTGRGITLNSLREQQYALNRQLLLAIQLHDAQAQEQLQKQLAEIQKQIDCIGLRM